LTETDTAPAVTGFHHFSPTVSDVEASAQWYERVFRMNRVPVPVSSLRRRGRRLRRLVTATPMASDTPNPGQAPSTSDSRARRLCVEVFAKIDLR
jgi:hypothetical protein